MHYYLTINKIHKIKNILKFLNSFSIIFLLILIILQILFLFELKILLLLLLINLCIFCCFLIYSAFFIYLRSKVNLFIFEACNFLYKIKNVYKLIFIYNLVVNIFKFIYRDLILFFYFYLWCYNYKKLFLNNYYIYSSSLITYFILTKFEKYL